MTEFLIAHNPRHEKDIVSGDWKSVEAIDKYDALNKLLNMPTSGFPTSSIFGESKYIYIFEIKPGDRTDLKK